MSAGLLNAVGLGRPELRAWALYDWANSAFVTTVMAAVLPVYYHQVAGVGLPENVRTAYWGYTLSSALVVIAVLSPLLGAVADYLGAKKRFLAGFAFSGALATLLLYFVREGDWLYASAVFLAGNIAFAGSEVFYESLLPHIARQEEIDRVSTAGYAVGYVGGGCLLAVQLAWITFPESFGMSDSAQATRIAFLSVGLWWAVFTVPLLRRVPEPPRRLEAGETQAMHPLLAGYRRNIETFRELRRYRQPFKFLLAFWLYNDGINTIIKMATIYGAEIGISQVHLIGALLLVQFLGVPATFAYGALADRWGTKKAIYLSLWVYTGISLLGYFMAEAWHFWALAVAVALVQGGSQALSRSLFAGMIPAGKSSQFFGLYSVSGKFGNIVGPLVFALISQAAGGSRLSILALVLFFLGGMIALQRVDVEAGRQRAAEEDALLRSTAEARDRRD